MRILPLIPLLLAAPLGAQTGVLDQQSPFGNASFNMDSLTLNWQQQILCGTGGTLEGIAITLRSPAGVPGDVDVSVRMGAAWSANPVLWSGTVSTSGNAAGSSELIFVDMSSANITLASGDEFVMDLTGTGTGVWMQGSYEAPPALPQYSEPLYLNQNVHSNGGWRLGFETYMLTGPPTPTLAVNGNCPGAAAVDMANLTPGGLIAIAVSAQQGSTVLPGGPCAGTTIDLLNPVVKVLDFADATGSYNIPAANVPAVACGTFFAMGFDVSTCVATNIVAL